MISVKKLLAILLSLCVLTAMASLCAVGASAAETHTITFDTLGIGETPDPVQIADGEKYTYLGTDNVPHADGYIFHCWATTAEYPQDEVELSNTVAYLETPVTEDMTLYAVWYKLIDAVEVTVDRPVAGDVIGTKTYETPDLTFDYQYPRPNAQVTTEGAEVEPSFWTETGMNTFWLSDAKDPESVFKGTFEKGKTYGVSVFVVPKFGYEFTEEVKVTFNGESIGEFTADRNICTVTATVTCGDAPAQTPTSAVKPTEKAATPDQKTNSGSNPNAVKTGNAYPTVLIVLMVAVAGLFFIGKINASKKREK